MSLASLQIYPYTHKNMFSTVILPYLPEAGHLHCVSVCVTTNVAWFTQGMKGHSGAPGVMGPQGPPGRNGHPGPPGPPASGKLTHNKPIILFIMIYQLYDCSYLFKCSKCSTFI